MALVCTILILLQVFLNIECSHLSLQGYTPLKINEIACTAEKLRVSKANQVFNIRTTINVSRINVLCLAFLYSFCLISISQQSNGGRYTCNHEGDVHCSEGWDDEVPQDDTNRCAIPKCDAECKHGLCTSPNFCACEVGW